MSYFSVTSFIVGVNLSTSDFGDRSLTEGLLTKEFCNSHISAHGNWPLNGSPLNGQFDVYPQRLPDSWLGG